MAATLADEILKKYEYLKSKKGNWNQLYQMVAHFIYYYKQGFTSSINDGGVQNAEINDSQALRNARTLASFLRGMLWPSGGGSFNFTYADSRNKMSDEVKIFFEFVTSRMREILDDPDAGMSKALSEYFIELVIFGTAGISVYEVDEAVPLFFKAHEIKGAYIAENKRGLVDTLYVEREYTIDQLVEEYGYDNLSAQSKKAYDDKKYDETVWILHAIEPRRMRNTNKRGSLNMPYRSVHLEIKSKKILKEGGFEEFPVMVSRFYQAMGEVYGRSPAIDVLPDVVEINAIKEAITIAIEKQLDPPMAVLDDGRLGGGTVDRSPGGITVLSSVGMVSADKAIFPLYQVGDIKSAEFLIEKLQKDIENAFAIDRLLDFNNEARMTLGEVNIREKIRGQSLGEMLTRPETELFTPLLSRCFNILLLRGEFGVVKGSAQEMKLIQEGSLVTYIPESVSARILSGKPVYKISYISPAKRIQKSEEVIAIDSTISFANENKDVAPDVLDTIDLDEAIKMRAEVTGMPSRLFRTATQVKTIRNDRAAQQAAIAQREENESQMKMLSAAGNLKMAEAASAPK